MAKQSGIHQIRGKVRGMSYYGQKGVQDGLVRKINEGLSTRVKNDAAYANTRLNAAEFGTAGSFAGAVIRSISDRKRAMMKDFATGDLAKVVRAEFIKDDTHVWGKRQFVGALWRSLMFDKVAQYAKLPWGDFVQADLAASAENGSQGMVVTTTIVANTGWGSLLVAKGATSVEFESFFVRVGFNAQGDAPFRSDVISHRVGIGDASLSTSLSSTMTGTVAGMTAEEAPENHLDYVLVVAKPMKEIGSQKYILQELCTYALVPVEVQE